jgi:hypothetical protein
MKPGKETPDYVSQLMLDGLIQASREAQKRAAEDSVTVGRGMAARSGSFRSGPAHARAFLDLREGPPVEFLTPRRRIRQQ